MNSQKIRRILSVFLASPGDVLTERDIAVEVVHRLNKLIGPNLGWHIDLYAPQSLREMFVRDLDQEVGAKEELGDL